MRQVLISHANAHTHAHPMLIRLYYVLSTILYPNDNRKMFLFYIESNLSITSYII